jgi:ribonucleoside-diphosphate reductase alpha chain
MKNSLPDDVYSITHKFSVGGHEGYLIVSEYPDQHYPGAINIKMSKQGSTMSGLMDTVSILVSMALQHEVPLEDMVEKLTYTRFEPAGWTNNSDIREATSIMDYIFQWLKIKYLN